MLNVSGLRAGYGQSEALHGIDFTVAPGEIVVFVGRNGMGKTTLMKSLIGMLPARAGSIVLDGTDLAHLPSHARVAKGLAFVPQGRMIFATMTVQENIETGLFVHHGKQVPPDLYKLFPGAAGNACAPWRQPLRRPAAAARHCPRPGHQAESAAARRTDRRHPAVDHSRTRRARSNASATSAG